MSDPTTQTTSSENLKAERNAYMAFAAGFLTLCLGVAYLLNSFMGLLNL